jgi:hypothetical protein
LLAFCSEERPPRRPTIANLRLFIPDAKAGERAQPITPELAAILEKEREMRDDRRGWIFRARHSDAKTGHRLRLRRPFQDAVERAGLDPKIVTPHVMRHTAITQLVQAGVDLPTVQRISGHKTLAMVLRYTHVHGQHIDRAIRVLGRGAPEPSANTGAGTVTPELHTAENGALRLVRSDPERDNDLKLVRPAGLEPARPKARDFKSRASTNFAMGAQRFHL